MSIRTVGPDSTYPTIAAAMLAASAGDTLSLESGYRNESALVTVQNLSIDGDASSVHIDLQLGVGVGDVTLLGSAPIDVRDNLTNNTITGNAGANTIEVSGGADVVLGGGGVDRLIIDYANSTSTITGTVGGVTDGGTNSVTFDGVENFLIRTGLGNDTITTADGDNVIRTAGGNDTITTGQGHSLIVAGSGNDTVTAGDGGNRVNGGGGDNTITTGDGRDLILTGDGNDTIKTGGGADLIRVTGGIDTVDSGHQADLLTVNYASATTNVTGGLTGGSLAHGYSGAVADVAGNSVTFTGAESFAITTGAGDDVVATGDGQDFLSGGAGHDIFDAGGGADTLIGGGGRDLLAGGSGADLFQFDALADSTSGESDVIRDLQGVDSIDLSHIDADVSMNGDQAFTLVSHFSGVAGEATFLYDAASDQTVLKLDVDGDGQADFRMKADGDHHADFSNFVL